MNSQPPLATIAVIIIVIIVALAGGIVTITHPETLGFDQYVKALSTLAVGSGLLGIGRGILGASRTSDNFSVTGDEAEFPGGSVPPDVK